MNLLQKLPLIFLLLVLSMLAFACEKEEGSSELNIKYMGLKEESNDKTVVPIYRSISVKYYPNPFRSKVNFSVPPDQDIELFITNEKGDFKKFKPSDTSFELDFSEEKNGSFYCEIRIENDVYQELLVKIDAP